MAGKKTRDYEADLGPMGGQEELPLNEPERPVLRVSPGVAVSHEHLDKVPHGSLGTTPGVGPMEIWASFGIL